MNDIEKAIEMIDKVWHPSKYSMKPITNYTLMQTN